MTCKVPAYEVFAIEVPTIVDDDEKIIKMLGGADEIFYVFESEKRRLKLNFRPNMVYSKPACGDPSKVTALLLRFRKFRNRHTNEIAVLPAVIGRVVRMYKFDSLVDFQFGPYELVDATSPISPTASIRPNKYRVFYDELIVREPTTVLDSHLSRDVPLFLPPVLFSRQDVPFNYGFASRFRTSEYMRLEEKVHRLPTARRSRPSHGFLVGLEDPTPDGPRAQILEIMLLQPPEEKEIVSALEELFTKRPIWLRNTLTHHLKCAISNAGLKRVLLCVAYYMPRGPWGRSWIRFGYDPRLDPASRHYQVVDFRIKSHVLIRKILERDAVRKSASTTANTIRRTRFQQRRSDPELSWLDVDGFVEKSLVSAELRVDHESFDKRDRTLGNEVDSDENLPKRKDFKFSREHLPNSQQVMLALTDIEIPEVQDILTETPKRTTFDPAEGWLQPGSITRIRELMTEYLQLWLDEELSK